MAVRAEVPVPTKTGERFSYSHVKCKAVSTQFRSVRRQCFIPGPRSRLPMRRLGANSERAHVMIRSDPRTVRGSGPHGVSKVRNRGLPNSAAHRRGRRPPRGPPATLRAPATHTGAVLPGRPARFAWPPRPRRAPAPPPRRRAARGPTGRRRYGVNPAVNPRDTAALLLVDNVQCTRI